MMVVTGPEAESGSGVALTVLAAIITHYIFRTYEPASVAAHIALLFLPPLLASRVSSRTRSSIADSLLSSTALYLSSLTLSVLIYRISPFHPLDRYPGPFGCKLSKFWLAFRSVGGHSHRYIKRLHEQYGDVVRIGPNELSIRDATVIHDLLGPSGAPKGPALAGKLLDPNAQNMAVLMDTDEHLRRRRTWLRAMNPASLREYENLIGTRTKQLVSRLEEQTGMVQIDKWFQYFTYDLMSDLSFGQGPELLAGGDKWGFWTVLEKAIAAGMIFSNVPWLGAYVRCIPPLVAPLNTLHDRCRNLATQRIMRGSETRDLFYYLNHEDMPEDAPPPITHLVDDGILALTAGVDTVASALASIFACLLAHTDAYAQLEAEVDKFYPPEQDVRDPTFHKEMAYLDAVINETLRLFPPVPSCSQRQVPHTGNTLVTGTTCIPPGTSFWIHAYSIHRDPRNFSPSPDNFIPERWLRTRSGAKYNEDTEVPTFVHNERAFIPFSYGPMNCVGKQLALQEIRTVVCAVLQRFRVRAAEGEGALNISAYEAEFKDFFMTVHGPVRVVLEVREPGRQC